MSTDEVYGPIEDGEAYEDNLLNPTSPYSASKAGADMLLLAYQKTYGLELNVMRCCNVFGPRQYPEKLVPYTITRVLQGEPVYLHGNGSEIREWICVYDVVNAICEIIVKSSFCFPIKHVGSRIRLSNFGVVCLLLERMEFLNLIEGDSYSYIRLSRNRPGNDYRYAIESDTQIGGSIYDPGVLDSIIEWYVENKDYWKNVDTSCNEYKEGEEYLR